MKYNLIKEKEMERLTLETDGTNIANFTIKDLERKLKNLKKQNQDLRKEKTRMKYERNLKLDAVYRGYMEQDMLKMILEYGNSSKNQRTRDFSARLGVYLKK